ncbi:MAG: hypothetical protein HC836_38755 [Richelia sp. RM2_1_2]|nr:hypothetical protein [Richelia sp. RM2_1_2]
MEDNFKSVYIYPSIKEKLDDYVTEKGTGICATVNLAIETALKDPEFSLRRVTKRSSVVHTYADNFLALKNLSKETQTSPAKLHLRQLSIFWRIAITVIFQKYKSKAAPGRQTESSFR